MGFQNREYARGGYGGSPGGDFLSRLYALLNWTFPVGTLLDTTIRVHITFIIYALFRIFQDTPYTGLNDVGFNALAITLLFLFVLMHEFGHVLACRRVGGQANEILLWPLGGLAFTSPPRRVDAEFWTVAWGPLVNLILAAGFAALLLLLGCSINFNPFAQQWIHYGSSGLIYDLPEMLQWTIILGFSLNYGLLLFNMALLFYPFDGGRLVQIGLWTRMGYRRSLLVACNIGIIAGGLVGIVGLFNGMLGLTVICVFGVVMCMQQKRFAASEPDTEDDVDTSAAFEPFRPSRARKRKGPVARWRERRALSRELREQAELEALQAEVDRILAKVHEQGIHSLTPAEKRTLTKATDRERQMHGSRR